MRKSIQCQVKEVKKGKILIFFKQRHVSEAKSTQQFNDAIIFLLSGLQLSKIAFECMTSSLGTMGKIKTSLLGVKNLSNRVETLHTGWGPLFL